MGANDGVDDGYVTELEYTYRYCPELAPSRIALACIARGLPFPQKSSLRYLELAIGQGVSINIHAAACPGEYQGFDLNPGHIDHALRLAGASGAQANLSCESLADFAASQEASRFDVVAMHGTWSWISAENRHLVVEILRRRLAPDGVCLISYNCLPGWAGEVPLRHLLVLHSQLAPGSLPLAAKIDDSLAFAQALLDAGAAYFDAHRGLEAWLQNLHRQDRSYLAHEYFNRDWHPMPSSEVARALAGAGLEFGASATLAGQDDAFAPGAKERELLSGVEHPVLRETVLDYLANRRFRSDLFVRRGCPRDSRTLFERIGAIPFALAQHPEFVPSRIRLGTNDVDLHEEVHRPLVQAFAEDDFAPKTLDALTRRPGCAGIAPDKLAQTALALTEAGYLHPAQQRAAIERAKPRCEALNAHILELAETSGGISALASPVTGGGVFAAREEMLFLRARALGQRSEDEWARHAWDTLSQGDPATLRSNANAFARTRLPVLQALGIA